MTQTLRLWIDHLSLWSGHCVFNKTKLVKMKSVSNATRVRTAALVYTSSYLCVTYKHLWRVGGYVLSNYTSLCGKNEVQRSYCVVFSILSQYMNKEIFCYLMSIVKEVSQFFFHQTQCNVGDNVLSVLLW